MSFCPKCGTEVLVGGRFCPSCGAHVPGTAAAAPTEDPYLGRIFAKKYRIDELLGLGGMGRVYRATQLSLDKTVCVKLLRQGMMQDDTLVGRFHREARAASRLNHPNSIAVTDFGQADDDDGSLYMVMEFVPGKDLGKVIREEWPVAEKRVVNIMDQVLSALADAHEEGIIHRDLKPENIMVTQMRGTKDFVKVLDFGIAKIQETASDPGLTQAGMVCGTPEYMSPEQARGEELDARSDVYAAGVIIYQTVVGRIPFEAPTAMGIVTKHLTEPPVPPSQIQGVTISPALEAVILKAMSKDKNGRQNTALALQQELNAVLSQKVAFAQQTPLGNTLFEDDEPSQDGAPSLGAGLSPPPTSAKPTTGKKGGLGWLWILIGFLLVAGGAAAGYFLWYLPSQEDATDTDVDAGVVVAPAADAGAAPTEVDAGPATIAEREPTQPEPVDAGTVVVAEPDAGSVAVEPPPEDQVSESARLMYQAGVDLQVRNKLKKAIGMFRKAVKDSPDFAKAYKALGQCHMQLGHSRAAKNNFRKYLEKAPDAEDSEIIQGLIDTL